VKSEEIPDYLVPGKKSVICDICNSVFPVYITDKMDWKPVTCCCCALIVCDRCMPDRTERLCFYCHKVFKDYKP
jgi:hypothetical protein